MATMAKINELHAFLFITRQKLKTGKVSGKSIFFFLLFTDHNGGCLMATENDFVVLLL